MFGSLPDDVEKNEKVWKEVSTYCSVKFDLLAVIIIALQLQNIIILLLLFNGQLKYKID